MLGEMGKFCNLMEAPRFRLFRGGGGVRLGLSRGLSG